MKETAVALSKEETISRLEDLALSFAHTRKDGALVAHDVDLPPDVCDGIVKNFNVRNIRKLSHQQAGEIARDLREGRFSSCYDPIIFRPDWSLMNGQHRCAAGAASGVGVPGAIVVFDAQDDAARSIDAGRKRTIAQTHNVPPDAAACTNIVLCLESRRALSFQRSLIAERYSEIQTVVEVYTQKMRSRPILKEAHLSACFAFAEIKAPSWSTELRDLAEDLATGQQDYHSSKLIAAHVVARRRSGVRVYSQRERFDEALLFLRAIQTHLLDAQDASLSTKCNLDWWDAVDGRDDRGASLMSLCGACGHHRSDHLDDARGDEVPRDCQCCGCQQYRLMP